MRFTFYVVVDFFFGSKILKNVYMIVGCNLILMNWRYWKDVLIYKWNMASDMIKVFFGLKDKVFYLI